MEIKTYQFCSGFSLQTHCWIDKQNSFFPPTFENFVWTPTLVHWGPSYRQKIVIVHFENSHRPTPFHEIFAEFGSIAQTESGLWTYAKFGSLTNAYPVCGRNMTQRPLGAACGRPNPTYDNPYEAYNTK